MGLCVQQSSGHEVLGTCCQAHQLGGAGFDCGKKCVTKVDYCTARLPLALTVCPGSPNLRDHIGLVDPAFYCNGSRMRTPSPKFVGERRAKPMASHDVVRYQYGIGASMILGVLNVVQTSQWSVLLGKETPLTKVYCGQRDRRT